MKSKTLYRDILKNSFNITFKNKILWFFGLFAAPLMGMAEYKIFTNGFGGVNGAGVFSEWYQIINTILTQFGNMGKLLKTNPVAVLILLIILSAVVLFLFFLVWVAVVAQCTLIDGINQSNSKKLNGSKINTSISSGTKNFFPVLGIHFLVKIILAVTFLLLSLPIVAIMFGGNMVMSGTFYFILSLVVIPLVIIIMFSSKYAINYIIIEKKNFFEAIKDGYHLFLDNWLITIEMSLILFFISVLMGLFLALMGSFAVLPLALLIYILIQIKLIFLINFILILGFLFLVIATVFFVAIFSTFQYSNWVLLFNRLKGGEGKEAGKLARWFSFKH